jgi:hypothetical protein
MQKNNFRFKIRDNSAFECYKNCLKESPDYEDCFTTIEETTIEEPETTIEEPETTVEETTNKFGFNFSNLCNYSCNSTCSGSSFFKCPLVTVLCEETDDIYIFEDLMNKRKYKVSKENVCDNINDPMIVVNQYYLLKQISFNNIVIKERLFEESVSGTLAIYYASDKGCKTLTYSVEANDNVYVPINKDFKRICDEVDIGFNIKMDQLTLKDKDDEIVFVFALKAIIS